MSLKNLSDKKILPYLEEDSESTRTFLVVKDMKLAAYLHSVGMEVGKINKSPSADSPKLRSLFYMVVPGDAAPETIVALCNDFYADNVSQETECGNLKLSVQPYHVLRAYTDIRDITVNQQGVPHRGNNP